MTESDLAAVLGNPGDEYRYPIIENKSSCTLVYLFTQTKGFSSQTNTLKVELDKSGKVIDTEYSKVGNVD